MRHIAWPILLLSLASCGGDKQPSATLSVTCGGNTQLYGAVSIEVPGGLQNGRPALVYPDPVNPGKYGTIAVQPGDRCKIAPVISTK